MWKIAMCMMIVFSLSACSTSSADKTDSEANSADKRKISLDDPNASIEERLAANKPRVADCQLDGKSGSEMTGRVVFTEAKGRVYLMANFSGVTQGKHAIHIHDSGDCSSADGKSAGGHWNPTSQEHGKWGVAPFHLGDIGNFEADKNGNAIMKMDTDLWCVGCGDETKDVLGHSIIIHAGEDDCKSQPSGAAGARIACGTIEPK